MGSTKVATTCLGARKNQGKPEDKDSAVLIHVTTVPETLNFFRGQIGYMKDKGLLVHAVSSPGKSLEETASREAIPVHAVKMSRRITPMADLRALYKLCRLFLVLKPVIVHAHTPKGGLLGTLAARMARVPVVAYTMHGLPFNTATGLKRRTLIGTEAMSCRLADLVFAVSRANRRQVIALGLCSADKIKVLGSGSCNGVDAEGRFNPYKLSPGARAQIRKIYNIPDNCLVLGFVGRIVRDKGIVELEVAWRILRRRFPHVFLLMVGDEEPQDLVPIDVMERLRVDPQVIITGWADPVPFYAAMDLMVLPTYREGFPVTPLEAAAMELPVVATRVDGCEEAVVHGETGLLVPVRDSTQLAAALETLIKDAPLRNRMGVAGRAMVMRKFRPEIIWESLCQEYNKLITNCSSKS
jgi:glycosyltransferase involved in cell wall biosynthesis